MSPPAEAIPTITGPIRLPKSILAIVFLRLNLQ
jgi:hypothetical protein